MYCNQCGSELNDGAVFCTSCGAKLTPKTPEENPDSNYGKTIGLYNNQAPNTQQKVQPNMQSGMVNQQPPFYGQQKGAGSSNPNYSNPVMPAGAVNNKVTFGEAVQLYFKNYVNFTGRASKSEYWLAFLFNMLVNMGISTISSVIHPIFNILSLAFIIPGFSLSIRRLHDTGKSWVYIFMSLIPIAGPILLIMQFCKDSDGDNEWGSGPYYLQ